MFVEGMHCSSCEVLIERKLLGHEEIKAADVSLNLGRVDIVYKNGKKLDTDKLNQEFKELGYSFSSKKFKYTNSPLFSFKGNGSLQVNQTKLSRVFTSILLFVALIALFFIFENLQLGKYVSLDSTSALPAFFMLGLVASVSSCAALIGGLLLSMTKQWNELYITENQKVKAIPHLLFHSGRIVSFFMLGGVLGLIGEAVSFSSTSSFAILTIIVSLVMLLLGLQMLGVSWARRFSFSAPRFLSGFAADESNFKGKYMPFLTGVMTFFLPCGFTLIAQTIALTTGSFLQGALVMLFFALGTLPMLALISAGGLVFNKKPHLTATFNLVAGFVIVFFVIYNINGQLNVLGAPSLSDIRFDAPVVEAPEAETDDTGSQIIPLTAKGFQYIPTGATTVKSGVTTKLIVDNQGIEGCGSFLTARGLINKYVALKKGVNEIDLGKPAKGIYKITCSMGMVPPVIVNVI